VSAASGGGKEKKRATGYKLSALYTTNERSEGKKGTLKEREMTHGDCLQQPTQGKKGLPMAS